jgi:plastocyanin
LNAWSFVKTLAAAAVFAAAAPGLAAADGSPAQASPAATVDTKNYAYSPDPVTVHAGDTVLFKNSDSVAHTVTASDQSFDSDKMDHGATWSHVFAKAGTYTYFCAYHTYMRGTIVVKAP